MNTKEHLCSCSLIPYNTFSFCDSVPPRYLTFTLLRFHVYKKVQPLGKESKEKSTEYDLFHVLLPLMMSWSPEKNSLHHVKFSRKEATHSNLVGGQSDMEQELQSPFGLILIFLNIQNFKYIKKMIAGPNSHLKVCFSEDPGDI